MNYSKVGSDVSNMFATISKRYDLANSILSFGVHHLWRGALLRAVAAEQYQKSLDLCTGTADLVPLLLQHSQFVVGADFCEEMLAEGRRKLASVDKVRFSLEIADAMSLKYQDASFDLVTVAFGVRNFENLERGIKEIYRVLRPGGALAILEFGQPVGMFGALYNLYSNLILPRLGGLVTGNTEAYSYLKRTSQSFPCADLFTKKLAQIGFKDCSFRSMTGGVCYLYLARK